MARRDCSSAQSNRRLYRGDRKELGFHHRCERPPLADPRDTVRQEIVTALERKMRVFPVLVGGAKMPAEGELPTDLQGLCRRNALEITEQDWDEDFAKLLRALETSLGLRLTPPVGHARSFRAKWAAVGAGGALIILAVFAGTRQSDLQHRDIPPVVKPPRPALSASQFVGKWEAEVTTNGQTLDEQVELYGDNSFRVMLRGSLAAVGRWRYNSATGSYGRNELPAQRS
jgi:hypothetical protein